MFRYYVHVAVGARFGTQSGEFVQPEGSGTFRTPKGPSAVTTSATTGSATLSMDNDKVVCNLDLESDLFGFLIFHGLKF